MKKDIYIIKNDLNDKVYIGQAKDSASRFKGHCNNKKGKRQLYIDKEINKLGKEHFWYEIIEHQIENYNERERYWIAYYQSNGIKGYNKTDGGDFSFINPSGTDSPYSTIKDTNILHQIQEDLQKKELTMYDIGLKYNVPCATISHINSGVTYRDNSLSYLLRPTKKGSQYYLTEEEKDEIRNRIKTELTSFKEIGKEYDMSLDTIYHINNGSMWKKEGEDYPLRKFHYSSNNKLTLEQVKAIHSDLINTRLSLRLIAEKNNTSIGTVQAIKNGNRKCYQLPNYNYPLRPNNFKKPVSTISAKESKTTIDT